MSVTELRHNAGASIELFSIIEDEHAILFAKGVYRQAKLYSRGDRLFAKHGTGFVRLHPENATSHPEVRWLESSLPVPRASAQRRA